MTLPLILLDWDGCINIFSKKPPHRNTMWMGEWKESKLDGQRLHWSVELVDELRSLSEKAEIVWLTDWVNITQQFPEVVGTPEWPFIDATDDELMGSLPWWKLQHVQEAVASGRRVVWIDDNIISDMSVHKWVKDHESDTFMSVIPKSYHGLTRKHISIVHSFIDRV